MEKQGERGMKRGKRERKGEKAKFETKLRRDEKNLKRE